MQSLHSFCIRLKCGTALHASPLPHAQAGEATPADTAGAMQAMATLLEQQTKILQQLALQPDAEEDEFDFKDDCKESRATNIWNEKLISAQEIQQVMTTHNYPMTTYLQRAMPWYCWSLCFNSCTQLQTGINIYDQ